MYTVDGDPGGKTFVVLESRIIVYLIEYSKLAGTFYYIFRAIHFS